MMMYENRMSLSNSNNGRMSSAGYNNTKQVLSFPVLSINDIILIMNELGISLTEDDIKFPEKYRDHIRQILEQLAEICTGISRDDMYQPISYGVNTINYPELHEESIPQINSFRIISKMMLTCGIQSFSIKDLMNPQSKRLIRQFSAIINFAKFREEQINILNELNNKRESIINEIAIVNEKGETLTKRLNILTEQTSKESSTILKIENECKDIENQIAELNIKQSNIREKCNNLKIYNNQLKDEINNKSNELDSKNNLKNKLFSQIVSSPEKVRKSIIDIGQSLKIEQNDIKTIEKKIREMVIWINNIDEVQLDVSNGLNTINELKNEVEKQKELIYSLDNLRLTINNKQNQLNDLEHNFYTYNRQITKNEEKLNQLRKQINQRGIDTQNNIENLHNLLIEAENFRLQIRAKADKAEIEVVKLQKECDIEKESMNKEIQDMITSYHKLEKLVISHLQSLRNHLEDNNELVNVV